MSETTMEFQTRFGEKFSTISGFAEALGDHARAIFSARKECAQAWRRTDDEARAVMEGRASKATVERVFHKSRGGWSVGLAVIGAVVGERLDEHLNRERKAHEEQAARMAALARDLSPRHRVHRGVPGGLDAPARDRRDPLDS